MREYELIYVIQPDATQERETEIHERLDSVITGSQGRILLRDDWGKRRMAYEIGNFQKGHYFQLNFLSEGKEISELERLLRLDADALRFLTILADEDVKDIEDRIANAAKQAEEQAKRREVREKEREQREAREKESADGSRYAGQRDDPRSEDAPRAAAAPAAAAADAPAAAAPAAPAAAAADAPAAPAAAEPAATAPDAGANEETE
ncbi:MAG: 30S ribosomal protein S6 [bacterium]|nr:30S ribosomal protein S6 [bacterium]